MNETTFLTESALFMVCIYLLPVFMAYSRRHKSAHAITALTLLLGWTLLGWVAAFIWALTGNTHPKDFRGNK